MTEGDNSPRKTDIRRDYPIPFTTRVKPEEEYPGQEFPEERPPEKRPPAGAPPGGEPSYLELIQRILEQHEVLLKILDAITAVHKSLATAPKPEDKYYDTPETVITVPTPTQPNSPDQISDPTTVPPTEGYQREQIYATLQRIAPKITVINDGSATLFGITSPEGYTWSSEAAILRGEARTFWNVWELRIRSPTLGTLGTPNTGGVYRVTERDYWLAYTTAAPGGSAAPVLNRAAFTAQVVNAPVLGAFLPGIAVPDGFALVIRATVGNAGQVFVANSIANAVAPGVPGNRITLAAGDTVKLFVTNANIVAVAGSAAGQNVDILVEQ